ncbi:MAG TPA: 2-oxo-4-hydroxy-4-carboxy-5-ureidoimidazoline decarboxylase [Acidobacteriaceae bacterium]|nr:2-oxo-4-hydroxy-4-carboxy-5-ureidoimidazoline decarboxylase [Acidobacteriaceae bacterium]
MSLGLANAVLARWNALDAAEAAREVLPCCGSSVWAESLANHRPFANADELFASSDAIWRALVERDWQEAFDSHPRIGQQHAKSATAESLRWSSEEQRAALALDEAVKAALTEGNRRYEERFGRIFIVCASGRSAAEILEVLEQRMQNPPDIELQEAAEQQRQITQLRLRRWLGVE